MNISYGRIYARSGKAASYYKKMLAEKTSLNGVELPPPTWREVGDNLIGIDGEIATAEHLSRLAENRNPRTGSKLTARTKSRSGNKKTKKGGRRMGYDSTVSADKAISLLALVGGDERVLEAFHRVCNRFPAWMAQFAAVRVRRGGVGAPRRTGHLLCLPCTELSSREKKPQLHRHNFCANASYDPVDKRLKALEPTDILAARMLLEARLNADMTYQMRRLGYTVESKAVRGCVVAGMPPAALRLMSDDPVPPADRKSRSPATLKLERVLSRPLKSKIPLQALVDEWRNKLGPEITATIRELVKEARARQPEVLDIEKEMRLARNTLADTLVTMTESHGLFSLEELEKQTLQATNARCSSESISTAIADAVSRGLLPRSEDGLVHWRDGLMRLEALADMVARQHELLRGTAASPTNPERKISMATWTVSFRKSPRAGNRPEEPAEILTVKDADKIHLIRLERLIRKASASGTQAKFRLPSSALEGKEPKCALAALMRMVWTKYPSLIKAAQPETPKPPEVQSPTPRENPRHERDPAFAPQDSIDSTAPPELAISGIPGSGWRQRHQGLRPLRSGHAREADCTAHKHDGTGTKAMTAQTGVPTISARVSRQSEAQQFHT